MAVYFIQAGPGGPIKIGYVRVDDGVEKRMASMQTNNHEQLYLRAVALGVGAQSERSLHRAFATSRIRGEWFTPTPAMYTLIQRLNSGKSLHDSVPGLEELQVVRPPGRTRSRAAQDRTIKKLGKAEIERRVSSGDIRISYLPDKEPLKVSDEPADT